MTPTGAATQELPDKNKAQAGIDFAKDVIGSPIERGARARRCRS